MPKTLNEFIWESCVRVHGVTVTVVSIVSGLLMWGLAPTYQVPLFLLLPCGIIVGGVVVVLADAVYKAWQIRSPGLPSVVYATEEGDESTGIKIVCLLEESDLFSYGMQVGFYLQNEDSFERLVGLGYVLNIQDDKRIQVELSQVIHGQEETINQMGSNSKSVIERLRVKPGVPHDVANQLFKPAPKADHENREIQK